MGMYSNDELDNLRAEAQDDLTDDVPDARTARVYFAAHRDVTFTVPSNFAIAQAAAAGKYHVAASFYAWDAEEVYTRLQNEANWDDLKQTFVPWSEAEPGFCGTGNERRSMSVGDIIVWSDRTVEIVDSIGFKSLPTLIGARLKVGERVEIYAPLRSNIRTE
jgi:hypothetical protein